MQNVKYLIIALLLTFGCSNDDGRLKPIDPNTIDISDLAGTEAVTPLNVQMTTPEGEEVTEVTQLKANTEYKLILKGDGVDFVRIKYGHIFETLEYPSPETSSNEFVYKIRTSHHSPDRIYLNVVPLHKREVLI